MLTHCQSRGSQMRAMATTNSLTILPFYLFFLLSIGLSVGQVQQQWDPSNYPNPTASDWKRCNMRSRALLCDPDAVLSEQERYRVNYELQQLESSTRQEQGREFCERKGISAAVALARKVRGGNQDAVRAMANDMLRRWNIDAQCQKAIVVVLSVEDRSFWVARMPQVPVYGTELNELFKAERENFRSGRYAEGVQNVLRAIQEKALSKQQRQPVPPDDGRSKGPPFVPPRPGKQRPEPSGGGGIGGFKWLMILGVLFLVVLPLLCCCCCIYFCFFRKKGDSGAGGGHPGGYGTQDPEGGGGPRAGGRGGGFGGLPLVGALSGIGGAATNFFNKRRGGGGTAGGGGVAGGGGQAPPPYYDPVPQDDRRGQQPGAGGKSTGLYPNVPVKDEGGGGSW